MLGFKIHKLGISFVCGLLLISCLNTKSEKFSELIIDENNSIILQVEPLSSKENLLSQYYRTNKKKDYLVHINSFPSDPNYIFFDDLKTPQHSFQLKFPKEGPNGVGNMTDFYFHNFDSIFVIARYSYRLSLIDSAGNLINTYSLKSTSGNRPNSESALPWVTSKSRMFLRGHKLFIPSNPDIDPYLSEYSKEQLLLELDLNSGELDYHLGYPTKYREGGYWGRVDHIIPSIAETKDPMKVLVSYPIDDSLYLYDLQLKKLRPVFLAKSGLLDKRLPGDFEDKSRENILKYQLGTDYYFSLVYDSYRDQYFRFAFKGYDDEAIFKILNREYGGVNAKSVLRFDSNFSKLNEYMLPIEADFPYEFYPMESGSFIILNTEDEDEKKFVKINFD